MATAKALVPIEQGPASLLSDIDLPSEDGVPMDTPLHRAQMDLLIDSLASYWQGRADYYCGGNMFIYYNLEHMRNVDYRGPDFFVVLDVDGRRYRRSWVVWQEGGRFPNIIVELTSPSTANVDRTTKFEIYEQIFQTPEYFIYDPEAHSLLGWRLGEHGYRALTPNQNGWLWSDELQVWLGRWQGHFLFYDNIWARFYTPDGALIPTIGERAQQEADFERQRAEEERQRAEEERQRAAEERQRADQAEATLAELRAKLAAAGIDPNQLGKT
jgi:Uma2 family endonuclease